MSIHTEVTQEDSQTLAGNNIFSGNTTFNGPIGSVGINTFANVNGYLYVDGVKYAQTDAGIQAALNACVDGGMVILPPIAIPVGANLPLTIKNSCSLVGSGVASGLIVAASVGATTDVILLQPTTGFVMKGNTLSNFYILPASGTPGRYGINLDGSLGEIVNLLIDHVTINQLGSNAIEANGSGLGQGTPALSTIRFSTLAGGVLFQNCGDTVILDSNRINGSAKALDVSFISGAAVFTFSRNNVVSDGGIHIGTNAVALQMFSNEIETLGTFTGSNGALLDIDATTGSHAVDTQILHNSFQVVNGITANAIRLNYSDRAHILGNRFSRGATTSKDIVVSANATKTSIGTNNWVNGTPYTSMVSDSSTSTSFASGFNGFFTFNNNVCATYFDDAGNQDCIINTDSGGVTHFYGFHGREGIQGVGGAMYLFDGNGSVSANIALATGAAASIQPGSATVVSAYSYALGKILNSRNAPTISSGFGTSPSVVNSNGSATANINVGTGGTASSGVIAMNTTAASGWNCNVFNQTAHSGNRADDTVMTASTTTTVTVQNQTKSTGAAVAWTASDTIVLNCVAF